MYTCVAFELMQLILHLIYPYSTKDDPFKFERNLHLDNGCSWLCICHTHTYIWSCIQMFHYHGYTIKTINLILIEAVL